MKLNLRIRKENILNKLIPVLLFLVLLSITAFAVPNTLNIQGKLTSASNTIQTGTFNFTFRLYDAYTSGNMLYEKANLTSTTNSIGLYDIILTDINISFDRQLYLGVEVNADGEMSPRINLTSVPYTFRANISDELDVNRSYAVLGLNVTENLTVGDKIVFKLRETIDNLVDGFLRISGSLNVTQDLIVLGGVNVSGDLRINNEINLTSLGNIDASGTITAGTLNAISALNVGGGFDVGGLTIQSDGDIVTQGDILFTGNVTIINVTHLSVNGSIIPALDNAFDIGNESLRWRSIYAAGMNLTSNNLELLGNLNVDSGSLFVDSALGSVGVGTTSPAHKLHVIGNVNITGSFNATRVEANEILVNGAVVNRSIDLSSYNKSIDLSSYNKSISLVNYNQSISLVDYLTTSFLSAFFNYQNLSRIGNNNINTSGSLNVSGQTLLAISSGNVGIGTTSPTERLVVAGNANVTGNLTIMGNSSGSTPAKNTLYAESLPKAWANFNGSSCSGTIGSCVTASCSIRNSFNVECVDRTSTGIYVVYWDRDFANANYATVGSSSNENGNSIIEIGGTGAITTTAGSVGVLTVQRSTGSTQNAQIISIVAFGNQ